MPSLTTRDESPEAHYHLSSDSEEDRETREDRSGEHDSSPSRSKRPDHLEEKDRRSVSPKSEPPASPRHSIARIRSPNTLEHGSRSTTEQGSQSPDLPSDDIDEDRDEAWPTAPALSIISEEEESEDEVAYSPTASRTADRIELPKSTLKTTILNALQPRSRTQLGNPVQDLPSSDENEDVNWPAPADQEIKDEEASGDDLAHSSAASGVSNRNQSSKGVAKSTTFAALQRSTPQLKDQARDSSSLDDNDVVDWPAQEEVKYEEASGDERPGNVIALSSGSAARLEIQEAPPGQSLPGPSTSNSASNPTGENKKSPTRVVQNTLTGLWPNKNGEMVTIDNDARLPQESQSNPGYRLKEAPVDVPLRWIHAGVFISNERALTDIWYQYRKRENIEVIHYALDSSGESCKNFNVGQVKRNMITWDAHHLRKWSSWLTAEGKWRYGNAMRGRRAQRQSLIRTYYNPNFVDPHPHGLRNPQEGPPVSYDDIRIGSYKAYNSNATQVIIAYFQGRLKNPPNSLSGRRDQVRRIESAFFEKGWRVDIAALEIALQDLKSRTVANALLSPAWIAAPPFQFDLTKGTEITELFAHFPPDIVAVEANVDAGDLADDEIDRDETPVPSAKALGKRRAVESFADEEEGEAALFVPDEDNNREPANMRGQRFEDANLIDVVDEISHRAAAKQGNLKKSARKPKTDKRPKKKAKTFAGFLPQEDELGPEA